MTYVTANRERLVQYFFFGVFLLLLWQLALMLSPFYLAILGSSILSLIVYPLHAGVLRRLKGYPSVAAALTTALVVLGVVVPIVLLGWVLLREAPRVYPAAQGWMENLQRLRSDPASFPVPERLRSVWEILSGLLDSVGIDLKDIFLKNLDELSVRMSRLAGALIRNTVFVGFNLLVLAFTLFFFLRDGPSIIARLVELIPMAPDHKKVLLDRVQGTLYAVIRGVLVIAAVQGFLTGVGFAVFGVPFPVLLGALATLLSPIPFIGAAGVWLPVAICLALSGHLATAVYVTLWCSLIVHTIDNVLRPLLIGSRADIPILLLFFGLLGGMKVYGFTGLLLGPIVIALVLAFISIYRQEYQWLLQKPQRPSSS